VGPHRVVGTGGQRREEVGIAGVVWLGIESVAAITPAWGGKSPMIPTGSRALTSGVAWAIPAPRTSSAGAAMVATTAPTAAVTNFVRVWAVGMVCSLLEVAPGLAALMGRSGQRATGAHFLATVFPGHGAGRRRGSFVEAEFAGEERDFARVENSWAAKVGTSTTRGPKLTVHKTVTSGAGWRSYP